MYEKLSKLFYKLQPSDFNCEYEKRKNSYGSYCTSLMIKGFRKGKITNDHFELFYVNTPELMNLNNEVLVNSSKISSLVSKLPNFVIQPYFKKLIINEAQSNNEIEGVRSTKKELSEALKELDKSEPKHKKFIGLMKTYLHIEEIDPFNEAESFRKLYDELVADEISEKNKPDGKLFRTGYVEVNDGNETTHIGVSSENNIILLLSQLIDYLNDESHPPLYRYMVAHYYYEYIHPFYDGNGRTGRLLVGSYLSRYLEKYSAITFSYAVNKNKSKYYKALEEVPSPLNKGEMTFYLISMLQLLSSGQKSIVEDLEINLMKLKRIKEYLSSDKWKDKVNEKNLFYILITINVFVHEEIELSTQDFIELSKKSRYKINQGMQYLIDNGYAVLSSKNPKTYKLRNECLEEVIL
nr:Fic family protein [Lysinibacillus timonensis]